MTTMIGVTASPSGGAVHALFVQLHGVVPWPPVTVLAYVVVGFWFSIGWFWLVPALAEAGADRWEVRHPLHMYRRRCNRALPTFVDHAGLHQSSGTTSIRSGATSTRAIRRRRAPRRI